MFLFIGIMLSAMLLLFIGFIWNVVKTIISTLFWTFCQIWKHYNVDVPMQKNGFIAKKQLEEKMIIAEKEQKYKDQILREENKIVTAGLSKVREYRAKYTYADENLFELFLRKYPVMSVSEINELEVRIKDSHLQNELVYSIDTTPRRTYTLEDINSLEALEEDREDPIVMRIYKIDRDYLLYIRDIDNNTCQLMQSKDYLVVARARTRILESQRVLRETKQKIQSKEIVNIFNETENNISVYRKNRLQFLN